MKILALDISKKSTGIAIGRGDRKPQNFTVGFKDDNPGAVGAAYAKWLRGLLITRKPDLVAFEAALVLSGPRASTAVMRLLLGLAFQTEVVCEICRVPYKSVAVMTWRKMFIGHGRPTNPKAACISVCEGLGWDIGGDDNRADACGVWAHAHFNYGDRKAIMRQLSDSSMRRMAG